MFVIFLFCLVVILIPFQLHGEPRKTIPQIEFTVTFGVLKI